MALTIEEQHETNDLDHDILATCEVTFICGHKRVYEDISACQKSWMERCQRCPNCQYKRDKAYVEKLSAEINSPELLEMWLKETPPTKTSRKRSCFDLGLLQDLRCSTPLIMHCQGR